MPFRVVSGTIGAKSCQILLRLHPPQLAPSVVTKCSHFSLGPFFILSLSSFLWTKYWILFNALFGYQLFSVAVELSITRQEMFRIHWTSNIHLAVLVSVFCSKKGDSWILWSEILFPSPWVALLASPTPHSLHAVIGGWYMKHPKYQCRHRDSGGNPAEDYSDPGRGEDLLNLFSFLWVHGDLIQLTWCVLENWWWAANTVLCKRPLCCKDVLQLTLNILCWL